MCGNDESHLGPDHHNATADPAIDEFLWVVRRALLVVVAWIERRHNRLSRTK